MSKKRVSFLYFNHGQEGILFFFFSFTFCKFPNFYWASNSWSSVSVCTQWMRYFFLLLVTLPELEISLLHPLTFLFFCSLILNKFISFLLFIKFIFEVNETILKFACTQGDFKKWCRTYEYSPCQWPSNFFLCDPLGLTQVRSTVGEALDMICSAFDCIFLVHTYKPTLGQ